MCTDPNSLSLSRGILFAFQVIFVECHSFKRDRSSTRTHARTEVEQRWLARSCERIDGKCRHDAHEIPDEDGGKVGPVAEHLNGHVRNLIELCRNKFKYNRRRAF